MKIDARTIAATVNEATYRGYGYWKKRPEKNKNSCPDEYINIVIRQALEELTREAIITWEDLREAEEELEREEIF